jgi:hypothetical protein
MRFPKTLTCCCLLAVSAATLVHSQDNSDAQQKALDALRQYTAEKEGKSSKPLTTKPVQKSNDDAVTKELEQKAREAAKPAQPAVAVPAAAPMVAKSTATPAAASPVAETEQERKAREALDVLRRGTTEPRGQALTAKTTAEQHDNAEAAARAALEASYAAVPTGNTISPDLESKARTSLDALTAQKPMPTASTVAAPSTPTPAPTTQVAVVSKPKPQTRKEKLNDLLELYMNNAITARQYHDQRAALIASN